MSFASVLLGMVEALDAVGYLAQEPAGVTAFFASCNFYLNVC